MIEIDSTNIITGLLVLALNLIPLISKKTKLYGLTLALSLLIVLVRIFFVK